jgi:hypothetical protein
VVLGEDAVASADRREVFEPTWVTPAEALQRADEGRWIVEFPTRHHLEVLAEFDDPDAVVSHALGQRSVGRVEPRIETADDGSIRIVVTGGTEVTGR